MPLVSDVGAPAGADHRARKFALHLVVVEPLQRLVIRPDVAEPEHPRAVLDRRIGSRAIGRREERTFAFDRRVAQRSSVPRARHPAFGDHRIVRLTARAGHTYESQRLHRHIIRRTAHIQFGAAFHVDGGDAPFVADVGGPAGTDHRARKLALHLMVVEPLERLGVRSDVAEAKHPCAALHGRIGGRTIGRREERTAAPDRRTEQRALIPRARHPAVGDHCDVHFSARAGNHQQSGGKHG